MTVRRRRPATCANCQHLLEPGLTTCTRCIHKETKEKQKKEKPKDIKPKDKTNTLKNKRKRIVKQEEEDIDDICPVCDADCTCKQRPARPTRSSLRLGAGKENFEDSAKGVVFAADEESELSEELEESELEESELSEESSLALTEKASTASEEEEEIPSGSAFRASQEAFHENSQEWSSMEEEEREIQRLGLDSDEEANADLQDPNALDHVWSSGGDATSSSTSHEESDGGSRRSAGGKRKQLSIVTLPPPSCKRKKQEGLVDSAPHSAPVVSLCSSLNPSSSSSSVTPSTPPLTSSSELSPTTWMSPEWIQRCLAARGLPVSLDQAHQLASTVQSPSICKPPSGLSSKAFQRWSQKEAKRLEALQAEAVGGRGSSSLKAKPNRASSAKDLSPPPAAAVSPSLPHNPSTSSRPSSSQPPSKHQTMLALEQVVEMEATSAPAANTSHWLSRWDRIPIGTFRRSRRVSKPLLKLSQAVKSTLGVVPRSLHETLLAEGDAHSMRDGSEAVKQRHARMNELIHMGLSPPNRLKGIKEEEVKEEDLKSTKELKEKSCACPDCITPASASLLSQRRPRPSGGHRASAPPLFLNDNDEDDGDDNIMWFPPSPPSKLRRTSMPFSDLSLLIHDPSNPPSACTSPRNVFLFSPTAFSSPSQQGVGMDKLELEPAAWMSQQQQLQNQQVVFTRRRRKSSTVNSVTMDKLLDSHEWP